MYDVVKNGYAVNVYLYSDMTSGMAGKNRSRIKSKIILSITKNKINHEHEHDLVSLL